MFDKVCGHCGETFRRRDDESAAMFRLRKTCSYLCSLAASSATRTIAIPEKRCLTCGQMFLRREGEAACSFRSRKGCSPECSKSLVNAARRGSPGETVCIGCGKTFPQREGEAAATFKARKYCTYECSALHKGRNVPLSKPCKWCKEPFIRRDGEGATSYRNRQTCSPDCHQTMISARFTGRLKRPELAPKKCEICDKAFSRRRVESRATFAAKMTCGKRCASIHLSRTKTQEWPPKPCRWCGGMFSRRSNEPGKRFSKRLTCGRKCQAELMIFTRLMGNAKKHPYPTGFNAKLRGAVRQRDRYACRVCGVQPTTRAHDVHHIDYDKHNIAMDNLITLCHPCHMATNRRAEKAAWMARLSAILRSREDDFSSAA